MNTILRILILANLVVVSPVALSEEILPGSWNVEMALAMAGQAPIPAQPTTVCLQNVKDLVNAGAGCSVTTTSVNGNHVDMKISCEVNGMKMDGTGSLSVAPAKVDGTLNLAMQMGNDQSVQTVTTLHAVRAGDCQR